MSRESRIMNVDQERNFFILLQRGYVDLAFRVARGDLAQDSRSASAHAALAHCFLAAERPDRAREEASLAIALSGGEDEGHRFLRARACYAMGDFSAALSDAAVVANQLLQGAVAVADRESFLSSARLLAAVSLVELGQKKDALQLVTLVLPHTEVVAGQRVTTAEVLSKAASVVATQPAKAFVGIRLVSSNYGVPA